MKDDNENPTSPAGLRGIRMGSASIAARMAAVMNVGAVAAGRDLAAALTGVASIAVLKSALTAKEIRGLARYSIRSLLWNL